MRSFGRRAVGLLVAYSALVAIVACSDLLGIKDFTAAGGDSGTSSSTDGSSSSGSEATSSSGSGSSGGSGSGSTSGSDTGTMPVITFAGYATASDHNGPAQALSSTLGWEQSAGDLMVLLINYDLPLTISHIGDSSGDAYTQFGSTVTDTDYNEAMYYRLSAKAAAVNANTVTVTLSGASAAGQFSVAVFGFRAAPGYSWAQDQYINNRQTNVTAVTTGSVTTGYANEVLVAGTGVSFHDSAGAGGGWVVEPLDSLGDLQEYLIVTSIQTNIAATFTQAPPGAADSQLGTFAAVPGSADGG